MHRVTGGIWIFLGGIFCVAIVVPGKADEQGARVAAAIFGVLAVAAGAAFISVMTRRVATLTELLLSRRSELRDPTITALRSLGTIVAHVISVRDSSGRRYRMRVGSEAAAREMLANIRPPGAQGGTVSA